MRKMHRLFVGALSIIILVSLTSYFSIMPDVIAETYSGEDEQNLGMSFLEHHDDIYAPIWGHVSQYHAFVCEYCVKVCISLLKCSFSWCFIKPSDCHRATRSSGRALIRHRTHTSQQWEWGECFYPSHFGAQQSREWSNQWNWKSKCQCNWKCYWQW